MAHGTKPFHQLFKFTAPTNGTKSFKRVPLQFITTGRRPLQRLAQARQNTALPRETHQFSAWDFD